MSQMLKKWLARGLGWCGTLLLVTTVAGCKPPADEPSPSKPEVTPSADDAATSETGPADDMPTEETLVKDDAAATPVASPEDPAAKDPLNTTDNSPKVKLGDPGDPVNLND